ncbi:MAG: tetratricopeptide repeat protein [Actinomycetota bacterium]
MSPYLEVTEQTFQTDVVERSYETPVVVDFWAAWCGPCRALGPVLEKLAGEADGTWTLAKVDVDANQQLSAALGIQGIPAVKAVKDGKIIAEFTGALPEPQVRDWLRQLGPTAVELLVVEGTQAEARGELASAADHYRAALAQEPANAEAKAALSRVELQLRAGGDEEQLRERVAQGPADVEAAVALSDVLAARGDFDEASQLLIETVRVTAGEERDRVRNHLLGLLDALPADDPRAMTARRALSLVLF